jgi:phage shock protein PspC (stress-responsive transcriptional regulator)
MTLKNMFGSESWHKFRDITRPPGVLGGVCAGLAEATPFSAWMWRALFLATTVAWGFGLVAYIILYIAIPVRKNDAA